uniref:Protein Wnt n=3 Tax=Macrostomum lignano TaxID=282301 RepID=A0A1I8IU69_9PLAT
MFQISAPRSEKDPFRQKISKKILRSSLNCAQATHCRRSTERLRNALEKETLFVTFSEPETLPSQPRSNLTNKNFNAININMRLTQLAPSVLVCIAFMSAAMQALWNDDDGSDSYLKDSRWWSLHRLAYRDRDWNVREAQYHFSRRQWSQFSPKKCSFDPELIRAALQGVNMALRECERQMATERWNCSRIAANYQYGQPNIFGRLLWRGIPETAFTLAIISAGVTASIAAECKRSLTCCPCHLTQVDNSGAPQNAITRPGCDHNIKFAKGFAKRLLDKTEKGRDVRYISLLHNYNTGRRAVAKTMKKRCLCHGTSGSCTYRTCWKEVASFQKIGQLLKMQYTKAVKVMQGSPVKIFKTIRPSLGDSGRRRRRRILNLVKVEEHSNRLTRPRRSDLVYYENVSSDFFCERQTYWSVLGTRQRICDAHGGNCSHICCGRPYRTEYYKHVDEKCNCRFIWCCEVKCEVCITDKHRKVCS